MKGTARIKAGSPFEFVFNAAPGFLLAVACTLAPPVLARQSGQGASAIWQELQSRQRQRLTALKSDHANAAAALLTAEHALAYARREHDHAAVLVAQDAVNQAQAAAVEALRNYSAALDAQRSMPITLPPVRMAAPTAVKLYPRLRFARGPVETHIHGHWIPLRTDSPLSAGAELRVGKKAAAFVYLPGGKGLFLQPGTVVRFEHKAHDKAVIFLLHGGIHFIHMAVGAIDKLQRWETPTVYTPDMAIANRGTEFTVTADGQLFPYSGEIMLTARPAHWGRRVRDPWWQGILSSSGGQILPRSGLARVDRVQGTAFVAQGANDKRANAGDVIDREAEVDTRDGRLVLDLRNGYRVVIGPQSKFAVTIGTASNQPLYGLLSGRLYAQAGAGNRSFDFVVANAVAKPVHARFAVSVVGGGLADFRLFDGKIDVRANDRLLDYARTPPWWKVSP